MRVSGPWSATDAWRWLDETRVPLRLACNAPSGWPLVLSLWFLPRDGSLVCATQERARVIAALSADPRCAFEVAPDAPPYCGVRGHGRASIAPDVDGAVLRTLLRRYLGGDLSPLARRLLARAASEVTIRIEPERLASFDYRERMRGA